jgi:hypothetical protein
MASTVRPVGSPFGREARKLESFRLDKTTPPVMGDETYCISRADSFLSRFFFGVLAPFGVEQADIS